MNSAKKIKKSNMNKNQLFRAYDIRGIYGEEVNPNFMFKLGFAVAKVGMKEFGESVHIYVGYDIRKTSQLLAFSYVSGLLSKGARVTFSGHPYPFGVVLYSGLQSQANFTSFITASHLPPDWNGIKFYYSDGVGFSESKILEIRDTYNKIDSDQQISWKMIQQVIFKDYLLEYKSFFEKNFRLKKQLNIILDCGNGSASITAPEILQSCNFNVTELWCQVDPLFPNRPSEPNETSLVELKKQIQLTHQFDFGVAFDGDGDRAVILDNKGNIVPADVIAILLAKNLKTKFGTDRPLVIANIECSSAIEKTLGDNFDIKRIAVGHTFLTLEAKTNQKNCVLGVESSGHFVFPQYFLFDDAMLVPLLLGQLLEQENEKLDQLIKQVPQLDTVRETFTCDDEIKFQVISELEKYFKDKFRNINTIDGVAVHFDNGYVLVRASNTSPKIRLYVESEDKTFLTKLRDEFSSLIQSKIHELS